MLFYDVMKDVFLIYWNFFWFVEQPKLFAKEFISMHFTLMFFSKENLLTEYKGIRMER